MTNRFKNRSKPQSHGTNTFNMLWAFSLSPPNLMPLTAFSVHPAINLCWQLCRSIPLFFNPGPQNFTGSHPSDIPLFNRLSNYPVCISSWDKPTHYKVSLISFFLGWCASPFSFFGARETPNRAFITLLCLPFAYLWWYLSGMPDRGNRSLKELTQRDFHPSASGTCAFPICESRRGM